MKYINNEKNQENTFKDFLLLFINIILYIYITWYEYLINIVIYIVIYLILIMDKINTNKYNIGNIDTYMYIKCNIYYIYIYKNFRINFNKW